MKHNLKKNEILKIISEIKFSAKRDIEPIIQCYRDKSNWIDSQQPGFWTLPRMIFPEIDGLARLRYGRVNDEGSTKDSVRFMEEYFSRPEYKKISGFLWYIFRLGLLHSHYPKEINILGKNRGWGISFRLTGKEVSMHLKFFNPINKTNLILDGEDFYNDFVHAIDLYLLDFQKIDKEKELMDNFSVAYVSMIFPRSEMELKRKSFLKNLDSNFFS
ncbi:MAG: hypothetical protein NT149_00470 [Candidatus Gottesmanbacteria bacterium]|nr:hypothetical protein [Candidatus Gottesmanbacteria bacterium]